jgi:hypothetical protein
MQAKDMQTGGVAGTRHRSTGGDVVRGSAARNHLSRITSVARAAGGHVNSALIQKGKKVNYREQGRRPSEVTTNMRYE